MSEHTLKGARARADRIGEMDLLAGRLSRLTARRGAGLLLHALGSLALVPAFVLLAPASEWHDPLLLVVLCVLAVFADRSDVPLPSGVRFDATIALMLLCVALAGPLPALAIFFTPLLVNALTGHERLMRAGNLANLASNGWQAIGAAALLELMALDGAPVVAAAGGYLAAGAVLFVLGWAVGPAVYGPLWLGQPLRAMVQALRDMSGAAAVMLALAVATALAYESTGMLALVLFAVVAVLPQSALTFVARTRPVARLDPLTASRRYAGAMAAHLGLRRAARRELDAVVRLAHARAVNGDPGEHLSHTVVDASEVSCAAGHVTEWWNGTGGPAGLPGAIIPESARIAAVARTWAALTAEGSPGLGHYEALAMLDSTAGVRLDPRVVEAARAVVSQERLTPAEPAPEPRLHRLHVPERMRRALAAMPV